VNILSNKLVRLPVYNVILQFNKVLKIKKMEREQFQRLQNNTHTKTIADTEWKDKTSAIWDF